MFDLTTKTFSKEYPSQKIPYGTNKAKTNKVIGITFHPQKELTVLFYGLTYISLVTLNEVLHPFFPSFSFFLLLLHSFQSIVFTSPPGEPASAIISDVVYVGIGCRVLAVDAKNGESVSALVGLVLLLGTPSAHRYLPFSRRNGLPSWRSRSLA